MAQLERIYVANDTDATDYYETCFRIVGATNWTQQTNKHPLPIYSSVSPYVNSAYIALQPLADGTDYEYQTRRWNNAGQFSDWFTGTFTTGV